MTDFEKGVIEEIRRGIGESKFGMLRLSVQGTNNGSGFDIFYDFGKSLDFGEFKSKSEFYFLQPWMQFPAQEYTDECMRVSIELVHRFNSYEALLQSNLIKDAEINRLMKELDRIRSIG